MSCNRKLAYIDLWEWLNVKSKHVCAVMFTCKKPLCTFRDPHIILFFHPIILFSNSFFDFPLFSLFSMTWVRTQHWGPG